jgi:uncharacterized LabA/DUF88 family protein
MASPTATVRLVLFMDWQNVYQGARECFGFGSKFHTFGQVNPVALGERIAGRYSARGKRELSQVRIYTGRPDPRQDPKTHGAHMRQTAAWEATGRVVVRTRTLRYPGGWPKNRAEEKGIDVQLAIDFVMGTLRQDFDVGVIFSTDTDLLPALEGAIELVKGSGRPLPEVASWREPGGKGRRRLNIPGTPLTCHWLEWGDYQACEDNTDYNVKAGAGP